MGLMPEALGRVLMPHVDLPPTPTEQALAIALGLLVVETLVLGLMIFARGWRWKRPMTRRMTARSARPRGAAGSRGRIGTEDA